MNVQFWDIDPSITAGTTLRTKGHSQAPYDSNNMAFYVGDKPDHVLANRSDLARTINIPLSNWVFPKITHSTNIHKVTVDDLGKGSLSEAGSLMNVDGIYTACSGVALAVFHADCIPLLFYDPLTKLIGAVHAGWVGTLAQITSHFITRWVNEEAVNPADVLVYIGPALSQTNFQVRNDVIKQVETKTLEFLPYLNKLSDDLAYFDAVGMNVHQLLKHGVKPTNITHIDQCTFDHTDLYFSYRKEGITGRNVSFISKKP